MGVRKRYDGGHGVDCDDDYELDDVDIVRQTHLRATCLKGTCAGITVICEDFNGHSQLTLHQTCLLILDWMSLRRPPVHIQRLQSHTLLCIDKKVHRYIQMNRNVWTHRHKQAGAVADKNIRTPENTNTLLPA